MSEELWNPAAKESLLVAGKNSDLWVTAKESIQQGKQLRAEKVTSHCTASQVARGEVEWEDYAGNGVADVMAKMASRMVAVDSEAVTMQRK